jgi:hypothetical protein
VRYDRERRKILNQIRALKRNPWERRMRAQVQVQLHHLREELAHA